MINTEHIFYSFFTLNNINYDSSTCMLDCLLIKISNIALLSSMCFSFFAIMNYDDLMMMIVVDVHQTSNLNLVPTFANKSYSLTRKT